MKRVAKASEQVKMALTLIYANPSQPRRNFDELKLEELAQSIRESGLMEPIVITPRGGRFMIIAGERRFRACHLAGLTEVPVRIIEADDRKVAELALLENLQREDLNLIEEARAYQDLMDRGLTLEEMARKLGIKQPHRITERLVLLRMARVYQQKLIDREITPTQAYELARLPVEKQHRLYDFIKTGQAGSVEKLRALANNILVPPPQQVTFGLEISEDQQAIGNRYDRIIQRLVDFVRGSYNPKDLKILPRVVTSNLDVNVQQLDLIIGELNKIRKAMVQAQGARDAAERRAA